LTIDLAHCNTHLALIRNVIRCALAAFHGDDSLWLRWQLGDDDDRFDVFVADLTAKNIVKRQVLCWWSSSDLFERVQALVHVVFHGTMDDATAFDYIKVNNRTVSVHDLFKRCDGLWHNGGDDGDDSSTLTQSLACCRDV